MKNIENAETPKSEISILPPRPFRASGKVAQTAFRPAKREGKICIPTLNQTFADSRIPKFRTVRIVGGLGRSLRLPLKDSKMNVSSASTMPDKEVGLSRLRAERN